MPGERSGCVRRTDSALATLWPSAGHNSHVSESTRFAVAPVTLAERCDSIEAALARLSSEGLRVHPSSRIPAYVATLRRYVERGALPRDYSEADFAPIAVAIMESGEIWYALDLLLRDPCVPGWLPVMSKVVKGPYAPTEGHDQARDAQFELMAAASFRVAGADPEFAEPDLHVRVDRRRLLVAAKRVSSLASLENRVRKARAQIEAWHDGDDLGLIALDLTSALGLAQQVHQLGGARQISAFHDTTYAKINAVGRRVGEWASGGSGRVRAASAYARYGAVLFEENVFAEVRPWWSGPVPAFAASAAPLRRFLAQLGTLGVTPSARHT